MDIHIFALNYRDVESTIIEIIYLSCRIDANSLQKSPPCFTYLRTSSNPPCPPCKQNTIYAILILYLFSRLND